MGKLIVLLVLQVSNNLPSCFEEDLPTLALLTAISRLIDRRTDWPFHLPSWANQSCVLQVRSAGLTCRAAQHINMNVRVRERETNFIKKRHSVLDFPLNSKLLAAKLSKFAARRSHTLFVCSQFF